MASERGGTGIGLVIGLAAGLVLGAVATFLLTSLAESSQPVYVLTKELDVTSIQGAPDKPLRGVLLPGTTFKVNMRKGDINYVEFDTILFDRYLIGNAKPVKPLAKAPWNYEIPGGNARKLSGRGHR